MTSHRRYYYDHPGDWTETDYAKVRTVLQHACEACWWFNEPEVYGKEYGRLSFAFTVSARDQWWAHKRAMRLAADCYLALGKWEAAVPTPMWETLEPHTNRGRFRVPRSEGD